MATRLMGDPSGKQVLIVWGCPARGEDVGEAEQFYVRYLRAKKHQTGAYQAACMLFDPTGRRLLGFLYDNRPAGPDPALDADVISFGLVPVEEMAQRTRRSR